MERDPSSSNDVAPPLARPHSRSMLRQATLVLPATGERVKRSVTLRATSAAPAANDHAVHDDRTPLLGRRRLRRLPDPTWTSTYEIGRDGANQCWQFATSPTGQGIIKCSLAYLLGSLATFVTPIAAFLGHQDGKHIVATITVYFHSARSQGSMFEATMLATLAFLYATLISFASMGTSVAFEVMGSKSLGQAIVLLVFCGGGLGYVGWLKQRLGSPLVNVACSLTSLAIITVLTKEGAVQSNTFSVEKIDQVLKMVVMGILATAFVCLAIKPVSARKQIREAMIKANDSLGEMLVIVTRSFLNGAESEMQNSEFKAVSDQYNAVFSSITRDLREAKFEHYAFGTEDEYQIEAKLVKCMQRLAQSVGGLRSAAATQFNLLSQADFDPVFSRASSQTFDSLYSPPLFSSGAQLHDGFTVLAAIDERPEEEPEANGNPQDEHDAQVGPRSNEEVFERFITQLGPSLKSLAYTMKHILDELPYGPGPDYRVSVNANFQTSLTDAIELYSHARAKALERLYKSRDFRQARPTHVLADFEEIAASCGYFSFSLQEFGEAMKLYLDVLDELKQKMEHGSHRRSWRWLRVWRKDTSDGRHEEHGDAALNHTISQGHEIDAPLTLVGLSVGGPDAKPTEEKSAGPHEPLRRKVWRFLNVLRRDDIKFAIKVGVGAALWALPSFMASTRPFYSHWRGEWGLLSYMLVCSMTVGASNTTGVARFVGTCIGAACAIVSWGISQGNAYGLAILGWLVSLPCFYIILARGRGPMGRFILLTYNLSALYAYSISVQDGEDDDDEGGATPDILEITLHRVVAVLTGCLWGLYITRVIWPISARRELKNGLSLLWLRMGQLIQRDPFAVFLAEAPCNATDSHQELVYVSRLQSLRTSAASEYELRGPFPDQAFANMIKSTEKMLDAFHSMNVVIQKDPTASEGETKILKFTSDQRAQLCRRIGHLFQVLASSMKLEYPLSDALPNTEHARDRLLARIFEYRKNDQMTRDEDYALLYVYALVTGQMSEEITKIARELEMLFNTENDDLLKLQ